MHVFPHCLDTTKTDLKPDHCNNSAPHNKPGSVGVGKTNSLGIDRKRDLNSEVGHHTLSGASVGFQHSRRRGCGTKQFLSYRYVYVYI